MDIVEDKSIVTLGFEGGSVGNIHYFANGCKAFSKERIEVIASDGVLQLDNFRKLHGFGWKGFKKENLFAQDKGQMQCIAAFVRSIENGLPAPIDFQELMEVSHATLDATEQLRNQR